MTNLLKIKCMHGDYVHSFRDGDGWRTHCYHCGKTRKQLEEARERKIMKFEAVFTIVAILVTFAISATIIIW